MGKEMCSSVHHLSPHPCSYEPKGQENFPTFSTEKTQDYSNWPSLHHMPTHVPNGQTGHMITCMLKDDQGTKIDCANETQRE